MWEKSYGGLGSDTPTDFIKTSSGHYVFLAQTISYDGQVGPHLGSPFSEACWLVELDSAGSILKKRILGGSGDDIPGNIVEANDGGYVVTHSFDEADGDINVTETYNGLPDVRIIKIDTGLNIVWQHAYGGSNGEIPVDVVKTMDRGYAMLSRTASSDHWCNSFRGGEDYWLMKTDSLGIGEWGRCFGSSGVETPTRLYQVPDSGYLMIGYSFAFQVDGDITEVFHQDDVWIVKTKPRGILAWQKRLGGNNTDWIRACRFDEGQLVLAGSTRSTDNHVSNPLGDVDAWIVGLNSWNGIQEPTDIVEYTQNCMEWNPYVKTLILSNDFHTQFNGNLSFMVTDNRGCIAVETDKPMFALNHLPTGMYFCYITDSTGQILCIQKVYIP